MGKEIKDENQNYIPDKYEGLEVFNIPDRTSDGNKWIVWYEALRDRYGRKSAKELFMAAWSSFGSKDIVDSRFKEYFKKEGLEFEGTTWNEIKGFVGGAVGGITDTIGGILKVGAGFVKAFIIIIFLVVIMLAFGIMKGLSKGIGDVKVSAV